MSLLAADGSVSKGSRLSISRRSRHGAGPSGRCPSGRHAQLQPSVSLSWDAVDRRVRCRAASRRSAGANSLGPCGDVASGGGPVRDERIRRRSRNALRRAPGSPLGRRGTALARTVGFSQWGSPRLRVAARPCMPARARRVAGPERRRLPPRSSRWDAIVARAKLLARRDRPLFPTRGIGAGGRLSGVHPIAAAGLGAGR